MSICPVTVIMPAHNAGPYIAQAVHSVLWQTYKNFELWILENGSTDATLSIAKSFTDKRIRVFELGKVGFRGAINFAIYKASSPWLARMDADDMMFPERLERQMALLSQQRETVFVGTSHMRLTPFGHIVERLPLPSSGQVDLHRLATNRGFVDPSVVFKRSAALQAGGLDTEFSGGEADIAFWFKLASKGLGWTMGEALHLYRLNPTSVSRAADYLERCKRVWKKYAAHYPRKWSCATSQLAFFWTTVAGYELIAGDRETVVACADRLASAGEQQVASQFRWRARAGWVGRQYYRLRNLNSCRPRGDIEPRFLSLLKSAGASNCSLALNGFEKPVRRISHR